MRMRLQVRSRRLLLYLGLKPNQKHICLPRGGAGMDRYWAVWTPGEASFDGTPLFSCVVHRSSFWELFRTLRGFGQTCAFLRKEADASTPKQGL